VDFKNTIIILTSNLGSPIILEGIDESGELRQEARDEVSALLRRQFRPEFLNRLDETVFYKPLTRDNMRGIIDLMLESLRKRLADKQLSLTVTDNAKDLVIARGYDPMYGARPLRRFLQQSVETLLARHIIANDLAPETVLTVDEAGGKLYIR
jgi:ATP-dependent Clp protease ATP-binding subunit ClpB